MASIKELQALFQAHQEAEKANVLKAAAELQIKMHQDAVDLSDLLIQAVGFEPFIPFPKEMFSAVFKTALNIFEAQGTQVRKDLLNNNAKDLITVLEAIDPRMDPATQAEAIKRLTAVPAKVVDVPRYSERKQDKKAAKKARQPWDENTVAAAMARAKADAEAKAKANPAGLPEGAVDLTATV